MVARTTNNGPDQRELVHHSRGERQKLADLNARDVRIDGRKLTANFQRRIRLEIHHVLVRRATRQEDHDDGLPRVADSGLRLGP